MLSNTAQKNAARNPNGTRRKNARAGGLGIRGGLGRTGGRHTRPPPQPPLGGGYGGGLPFACYPTARLATEVAVTTDHPYPKPHSSARTWIYIFFRMTLIVFLQPRLANFFSMPATKPRPSWPQALVPSLCHWEKRLSRPQPVCPMRTMGQNGEPEMSWGRNGPRAAPAKKADKQLREPV